MGNLENQTLEQGFGIKIRNCDRGHNTMHFYVLTYESSTLIQTSDKTLQYVNVQNIGH